MAGRGLTAISTGLRKAAGWCLDGAAWCAAVAWRRLPPVVLAASLAWPGNAAPPAGADPASPAAAWFRAMRDVRGISCCDEADCRRTMIRPGEDGGIEAWIGREEFGPGAPDEWHAVPAHEVRSRDNRPASVRGAIVCFYAGRVACADVESGS